MSATGSHTTDTPWTMVIVLLGSGPRGGLPGGAARAPRIRRSRRANLLCGGGERLAPRRGEEVEVQRAGRDDPLGVQGVVRRVVVLLDLGEVDRLGDPRLLVEVAGVGPQVRVVDDPPAVAAEVRVVHGVEAHQR